MYHSSKTLFQLAVYVQCGMYRRHRHLYNQFSGLRERVNETRKLIETKKENSRAVERLILLIVWLINRIVQIMSVQVCCHSNVQLS